MKTILVFLMLTVFMASDVFAAEKIKRIADCAGKGCRVVAARSPWGETGLKQGVQVKSGPFLITIPAAVSRVGLGTKVAVFRYEGLPQIVLGNENRETFQSLFKNLSLSQTLELLFTKTSDDEKLAGQYGRESWKELMLVKNGLLGNGGKAIIYSKASVTIYYIPDAGEPFSNVAWAVDADTPDSALRIESNVAGDKFRDILFSIRKGEK